VVDLNQYTVTANIPTRAENGETVAALIERLNELVAHHEKVKAEAAVLQEAIVEAKQRISRVIAVLQEALGPETERPFSR
jgi:hypothetical protein